jgi:ankyrin repeat protein
MITERIQQQPPPQQQLNNNYSSTKYYQFSTILEHVIDCFHTIVSDETNPYHQPFTGWLTRKQPKRSDDELFYELLEDCKKSGESISASAEIQLSPSVKSRLERCPQQLRKEIVARQQDGCSPLFIACRNGLTRVIKYLLDVCEADIEQKGRYEDFKDQQIHSVSPIWVAAVSGQLRAVKLLIERGADVNSVSDTGSTPVRSACFMCKDDDGSQEYDNECDETFSFGASDDDGGDIYMKIVCLLVEHGADILKPNYNGGTCLINSLHNYRLTKYIIEHGADVNAKDKYLKTALHYAIERDKLEVVKLLLSSGADPFMETVTCDDALQVCCIGGHVDIFNYLIENYTYDSRRLSDAYRLLGSSILEISCDLTQVRKYWTTSLDISKHHTSRINSSDVKMESISSRSSTSSNNNNNFINYDEEPNQRLQTIPSGNDNPIEQIDFCDNRRSIAYGDTKEFSNLRELQSLSVDDFRIQSLLISERVLGRKHRETIQRLVYRGTFYINSLRHHRCMDLWIYALKLRLDSDSIFHIESIFAAEAITRLFIDLLSQGQHQLVKFNDVSDVLSLLVSRLKECQHLLTWRPRSCRHVDIFDLLLNMIVNLLLILRSVRRKSEEFDRSKKMIDWLIDLNPRTVNGSSLLHICVAPNMLDGEMHRSLMLAYENMNNRGSDNSSYLLLEPGDISISTASSDKITCDSPIVQLIANLIEAGLEVDSINRDGLSALQVLCLATNIRTNDKRKLIRLLVRNGAHVDRRAQTPEQDEQIRQAMLDANVKPFEFVTLKCLAARKVSRMLAGGSSEKLVLTKSLKELIAIH